MTSFLGIDIGGANIKGAHSAGFTFSAPFPLWKNPHQLTDELKILAGQFPPSERILITMTGELCDCFATIREGVRFILAASQKAFDTQPVKIWSLEGKFLSLEEGRAAPLQVAAANWHALATLAAQKYSSGVLIDVGSTTTDLIPFEKGRPCPKGWSDPDRLASGELVYSGVRRTPLCAIFGLELACEFFAAMQDVYLLLGELPENPEDCNTADGRPATQKNAHARLARMHCSDGERFSLSDALKLAALAKEKQFNFFRKNLEKIASQQTFHPQFLVLSGSGEFLARQLALQWKGSRPLEIVSLKEQFGPGISEAACAFALVELGKIHF